MNSWPRSARCPFGFFLAAASLLSLYGCQEQSVNGSRLLASQSEAEALLGKLPKELRWREPAENPEAQERYVEIIRLAKEASGFNMHPSAMPSEASVGPSIPRIRHLLKDGPVQTGFDETLLLERTYNLSIDPSSISRLLLQSASNQLVSSNPDQAVEDICLAFSWMLQIKFPVGMEMSRTFDSFNLLTGITQSPALTPSHRKKILAALPSQQQLNEMKKNQVRQVLEERIYALAKLKSPRTDMVVSAPNQLIGYGTMISANPKTSILVPPHGTLDKIKTLEALIELARLSMLAADSPQLAEPQVQRSVLSDFVKWLPSLPPQLTTVTQKERDYVSRKVEDYVDEMNKGENTLGRQFLQSWQTTAFEGGPSLVQLISEFRKNLETPPMNRPSSVKNVVTVR